MSSEKDKPRYTVARWEGDTWIVLDNGEPSGGSHATRAKAEKHAAKLNSLAAKVETSYMRRSRLMADMANRAVRAKEALQAWEAAEKGAVDIAFRAMLLRQALFHSDYEAARLNLNQIIVLANALSLHNKAFDSKD